MGTFSLSDGFITEKGMAMRCGSVVVNAEIPDTGGPAESHVANCLHFAAGRRRKCIDRCPAYVLSIRGHDKVQCRKYREQFFRKFITQQTGVDVETECGVPCEAMNPAKGVARNDK